MTKELASWATLMFILGYMTGYAFSETVVGAILVFIWLVMIWGMVFITRKQNRRGGE